MYANDIPQLSAPVVLVPGLCGFDRLYALGWLIKDYFPGVRERLLTAGNRVYVAHLSKTQGVAHRAGELKRFIDRNIPNEQVHVLGHSMGGLDARYMVSRLGMEDRVRSLTTIGTPHRGSAFADWGVRKFRRLLTPFFRLLGISYQAFLDLTTEGCQRFNESVLDVPGVRYQAIAGVCEREWIGAEWRFPHRIVSEAEGPNDGVVSVTSAKWGEHTEVWAGDHLNLVNWPNRLARRRGVWDTLAPDYASVLRHLP